MLRKLLVLSRGVLQQIPELFQVDGAVAVGVGASKELVGLGERRVLLYGGGVADGEDGAAGADDLFFCVWRDSGGGVKRKKRRKSFRFRFLEKGKKQKTWKKSKTDIYLQPRRRHHGPKVRLRPRGQLGLQLLDQRVHRHARRPNTCAKIDLPFFAVGPLDSDKALPRPLPADLEHSGVEDELDARSNELLVRVFGNRAVVGGEEMVLELDDADAAVLDDFCFEEVFYFFLLEKVRCFFSSLFFLLFSSSLFSLSL